LSQRVVSCCHPVKTIKNTLTYPGLTQDIEHLTFMLQFSIISNYEKEAYTQKIWHVPTKNWRCILGSWYVWIWWICTLRIRISSNANPLLALTLINPAIHHWLVWNCQSYKKDSIIHLGRWHVTRNLNLLSLTIVIRGFFKLEFKQMLKKAIIELNPS
jgi:hypothetical protein